MRIIQPSTAEQLEEFRSLLREWFDYLVNDRGVDMGYQSIEAEGVCELKRLYVRPARRGLGAGRALAAQAIDEARAMGYRLMRLDTGTFLEASRRLYASLGFVETGPYYEVPPDVLRVTVFMELPLIVSPEPRC